jgi:hypothetical protein
LNDTQVLALIFRFPDKPLLFTRFSRDRISFQRAEPTIGKRTVAAVLDCVILVRKLSDVPLNEKTSQITGIKI